MTCQAPLFGSPAAGGRSGRRPARRSGRPADPASPPREWPVVCLAQAVERGVERRCGVNPGRVGPLGERGRRRRRRGQRSHRRRWGADGANRVRRRMRKPRGSGNEAGAPGRRAPRKRRGPRPARGRAWASPRSTSAATPSPDIWAVSVTRVPQAEGSIRTVPLALSPSHTTSVSGSRRVILISPKVPSR